jgi:hypothetical protein
MVGCPHTHTHSLTHTLTHTHTHTLTHTQVIEIRRELRDEPIYATVLHYSEYKGTFVLAFADGTLQDLDLKGVSFEIVHNPGINAGRLVFG